MKILAALCLLCLVPAIAGLAQPASSTPAAWRPSPLFADAAPICAPDDLRKVSVPNTTIESVTIDPTDGSCRVTAIVTHPPARDRVKVWIALPMRGWNGRFRGNGGGGFSGGSPGSLAGAVAQGFAAGATDAGHEGGSGSFALHETGRLNWQEIRNFAYQGIHDMTVVGKALVEAFYGKPPRYSYFVGNSTGGRQGLMEAQRFPDDYDGILSGCPAVYWTRLVPGDFWPQLVMLETKNLVSKAKLEAVTAAAVAACDGADGITDGVIEAPDRCTWDPAKFVGTTVGEDTFTELDAEVVRKIWDGPRGHDQAPLWYGLPRGANLASLAATDGTPLQAKPFGPAHDWLRYFLAQDPSWDWTTLTREQYELFLEQGHELYDHVFSATETNLTRFRDRGGKLIILHGLADHLIPPQGTVEYYTQLQATMGGESRTAEFARLFLFPGIDHGFRGAGPSPTGQLQALIEWVEAGNAPDRFVAESRDQGGNVTRSRPVYPFPLVASYTGTGSTDDIANFTSEKPAPRRP